MLVSKIEISFYPRERGKHPIIQKCAFALPLSIYIPHMRLDIKRKSTNAAESKTLQRIFNIQVQSSAYPFIPHIYTHQHIHISRQKDPFLTPSQVFTYAIPITLSLSILSFQTSPRILWGLSYSSVHIAHQRDAKSCF